MRLHILSFLFLLLLIASDAFGKVPGLAVPTTPPATTAPGRPWAATAPAARAGMPAVKEITELLDAKKYQQALAPIARLLELRGAAAAPYDRHQLFMMRAECLFQLKDPKAATAALAADLKELKDVEKAYEALAFSELITKSRNGIVSAQVDQKAASFNVFDREKRKDAYAALSASAFKAFDAAAKTAGHVDKIPPLVDAAKLAPVTRALEFVSTGTAAKSDAIAKKLTARYLELVRVPTQEMKDRVTELYKKANVMVLIDAPGPGLARTSHRQGIDEGEAKALSNIENTCHQLIASAQALAADFPEASKQFQELEDTAREVGSVAEHIRTDTY